ncbi:hypothetical protein OC861_006529 [Tilletia horrida]|nr:hypothetical protein OC861_006529 [Tilletia horrida]
MSHLGDCKNPCNGEPAADINDHPPPTPGPSLPPAYFDSGLSCPSDPAPAPETEVTLPPPPQRSLPGRDLLLLLVLLALLALFLALLIGVLVLAGMTRNVAEQVQKHCQQKHEELSCIAPDAWAHSPCLWLEECSSIAHKLPGFDGTKQYLTAFVGIAIAIAIAIVSSLHR